MNTIAADETWTYSPKTEIRAVWLDRHSIPNTDDGIRWLIRGYARAGINLVLPEVICNGYSVYKSQYLSQQDLWNGLDVLSVIVQECHRNRIEVHPWVWVFRAGYKDDKGGILKTHPEWAADADYSPLFPDGSYWLCPSEAGARKLLINAYCELVKKYNIDGIHLDYIRFPDQRMARSCMNDKCAGKFQSEKGIDPRSIRPYTKQVIDWHLWREELVNTFVEDCCRTLRAIKPSLKISAAVIPSYEQARIDYLQDWGNWIDNRWVDFVVPMDYTRDNDGFARRLNGAISNAGQNAFVAAGIGDHVLSVDQVIEQIGIARYITADGISLFSASYINQSALRTLKASTFKQFASLPFRNPDMNANKMLSSAMSRLTPPVTPIELLHAYLDVVHARKLLEYSKGSKPIKGRIMPQAPPIFIPHVIQPIPKVTATPFSTAPVIDGVPDPVWASAPVHWIASDNLGRPSPIKTSVRVGYDVGSLYLLFIADEPSISSIEASSAAHDSYVFHDDSVEVFVSPTGTMNDCRHFVLSVLGARYEELGADRNWEGEWNSAVRVGRHSWTAEIRIPYESLGAIPMQNPNVWHANFCRNRYAGGLQQNLCWSATYGGYGNSDRFGLVGFPVNKQPNHN